jgi:hypothetical protein
MMRTRVVQRQLIYDRNVWANGVLVKAACKSKFYWHPYLWVYLSEQVKARLQACISAFSSADAGTRFLTIQHRIQKAIIFQFSS